MGSRPILTSVCQCDDGEFKFLIYELRWLIYIAIKVPFSLRSVELQETLGCGFLRQKPFARQEDFC